MEAGGVWLYEANLLAATADIKVWVCVYVCVFVDGFGWVWACVEERLVWKRGAQRQGNPREEGEGGYDGHWGQGAARFP